MDKKYKMDIDNQSEDGEIKLSPDIYSGEEDVDTADSLDIKPPQAVVRHHRPPHRRDKHSNRGEHRDDKDRKSRHHERVIERHRDKHGRHRRHNVESASMERPKRPDQAKRDREIRHERKERNTGDRVLEDLRESNFGHANDSNNQSRKTNRLIDKRRERRDENREVREYKVDPRRDVREESRENREAQKRRDNRGGEMRERQEIRITSEEHRENERRHNRQTDEISFQEPEVLEKRDKRHKRSHKKDRLRDREREKYEVSMAEYREKKEREAMEVAYEEIESIQIEDEDLSENQVELTEQEIRRQRLLAANREMARRKESSRLELEARRNRKVRSEKRPHSPEVHHRPIIDLIDDLPDMMPMVQERSPIHNPINPASEDTHMKEGSDNDAESSDSSDSSSEEEDDSDSDSDDDDDDSDETNKDSRDSNENSDYNHSSPLSVGQLAKSDHSDAESPGQIDSNGKNKVVESLNKDKINENNKEVVPELPPYFPAIQGCRSVEEYKCLNRIAEGTYGVVYRAEDRRTKEIVALKRLKMEKEKDGFPITSLREINTLLKAQHPNIVTVREIVVGSNMDKIFIVMDYVEHDLKSLMETMKSKNQVFIPGEIKCIMQQLLRAVAHLHDNWILHRDLKTSNLLLSHRGILKVGDFGLAREYGSPLKQYTAIVVTLWYRAPELLLGGKEYSTPIDVWSVGCIFAELLRMEALFPGKSEMDLLNRIFKELGTPTEAKWPGYSKLPIVKKTAFSQYPINNLREKFSVALTDIGMDLLNKFLTYDPQQRITAEDALKHGYFTESPLPIDPSMFPTWPAKSEFGVRTHNASPKPPSGGKEFKQLGDGEDIDINAAGFHMGGSREASRTQTGAGFYLKF